MKRPMRAATTRWAPAAAAVLALGLGGCSYTNPPTVLQQYDPSDGVSTSLDDTLLVRNWVVIANPGPTPSPTAAEESGEGEEGGEGGEGAGAAEGAGGEGAGGSDSAESGEDGGNDTASGDPGGALVGPSPSETPRSTATSARRDQRGEFVGTVLNRGPRTATLTVQVAPGESGQPTQTRINVPAGGEVRIGPQEDVQLPVAQLPVEAGGLLEVSVGTAGGGSDNLAVPVLLAQDYYSSFGPSGTARPTDTPSPGPTENAPRQDEAAEEQSPAPTGVVPSESLEPESRVTSNP